MTSIKLSNRAHNTPASPIRKLAHLATKAKKSGIHVYHLNIGQPDLESPQEFFDGLREFKQKVVDTISKIQGLYWDLVGTIRDYEIRRESVKLAQITLQNNRKKVEIGTLAPIGITEGRRGRRCSERWRACRSRSSR